MQRAAALLAARCPALERANCSLDLVAGRVGLDAQARQAAALQLLLQHLLQGRHYRRRTLAARHQTLAHLTGAPPYDGLQHWQAGVHGVTTTLWDGPLGKNDIRTTRADS